MTVDSLPAPPGPRSILRERYLSNRGRTMLLRRQITDAVRRLDDAGVRAVLLKGGAYLAAEVFDDDAVREMSDIDILIRPTDLEAASTALIADGYRRHRRPYGLEQHDIVFTNPDRAAPIELHVELGTPDLARVLRADQIWTRTRVVEVDGTPLRVLGHEDSVDPSHAPCAGPGSRSLLLRRSAASAPHVLPPRASMGGKLRRDRSHPEVHGCGRGACSSRPPRPDAPHLRSCATASSPRPVANSRAHETQPRLLRTRLAHRSRPQPLVEPRRRLPRSEVRATEPPSGTGTAEATARSHRPQRATWRRPRSSYGPTSLKPSVKHRRRCVRATSLRREGSLL